MMENNYVEFTSPHNRYLLSYKLARAISRKILRAYLNQIYRSEARNDRELVIISLDDRTLELPRFENPLSFLILIFQSFIFAFSFPSLSRIFLRERNFFLLATFAFFFHVTSRGYTAKRPYTSLHTGHGNRSDSFFSSTLSFSLPPLVTSRRRRRNSKTNSTAKKEEKEEEKKKRKGKERGRERNSP